MAGSFEDSFDPRVVRVAIRFLALSAALIALVAVVAAREGWTALQGLTASAGAAIASAAGLPAWASAGNIVLPSRLLVIDLNCTAIYVAVVYTALVVAYPVDRRSRLLGVLVGLPLIVAANLGRLLLAVYVSERAPGLFTLTHDYLYQVGFVLIVTAIWVAWLSFVRSHES